MWIALVRALMLAGMVAVATASRPLPWGLLPNAALGVVLGAAVIFLETRIRNVTAKEIAGGFLGALAGVLFALLVSVPLAKIPMTVGNQVFLQSLGLLLFTYVGLMLGFTRGEWFDPLSVVAYFRGTTTQKNVKILDTSVIIDGRIADICETGFMDGTLVIPQFVLKELQQVADSADSLKRNRGRRGLDILQKVRKMSGIDVEISELDFPEVKEVDLKIIELAKEMDAKIVTNDFNLNKVAQLRGVPVLNINELANSLKPVVLPGEVMKVFIIKEGKEAGQGVGYLDDGTMVVVDQAKRALGRTIEVSVTSVLQTTAGKMIFCRWAEAAVGDDTGRGRLGDRRDPRNGRDVRSIDRREGDRREERWPSPVPSASPTPAPLPVATLLPA
ncbi:MAG TPA: PIN domain-containing protein, partial [Vicinamibacteria bacterium]